MQRRLWLGGFSALALLAAGCNKARDTSNAAADDNLSSNDTAMLDNGSEAAPVAVAPVPTPPANVPAADAAPLQQAAATASEIASASDVERIPYQGGWAWRRNGEIIRTASSDGRRVSYFRSGATSPYLVQDDGKAFAYSGGHVQRSYDDHGRPAQVDSKAQQQAQRVAQQAQQERDQARQVAARQPQRVQHERPQSQPDKAKGADRNGPPKALAQDKGNDPHPSATQGDRPAKGGDRQGRDDQRHDRNEQGQ